MEYIFICKKCGTTGQMDWTKGTIDLKCNKCDTPMDWTNAFPPQAVIDFEKTVTSLFELSKKCDKENLNNQYDLVKSQFDDISKTQLDKYINQYEKLLERYPDNDDTLWSKIDDEFENELHKNMSVEQSSSIIAAIRVCHQNPFRKAYIIMVASLIEQLFHDYFVELINIKLSPYGSKTFLKKYETAGIQSIIDITDSFLNESLKKKIDEYSKGFFDKWASLRVLRNDIIHSNNKYITKVKVSQINGLIEPSYVVFQGLKSDLYKE